MRDAYQEVIADTFIREENKGDQVWTYRINKFLEDVGLGMYI